MKAAEEAKALLAEKPYLQGFKIFKQETSWVTGRTKVEFFIKRRRLIRWRVVMRPHPFGVRPRPLKFESEREARDWIERNYPPVVKTNEIPL